MVNGTNSATGASSVKGNHQISQGRPTEYVVKSGENLTIIAKKFGMTADEFKAWTGLTSNSLKIGQKIPLATDTIPSGKGLFALAKKYGMSVEELCKLNGITKNYAPKQGELFYVKRQTEETATTAAKPAETKDKAGTAAKVDTATKAQVPPKTDTAKKVETKDTTKTETPDSTEIETITQNKRKYGSSYTPKELGENLYRVSTERWGAVGKPDFDALLEEINTKNVIELIKTYPDNPKNKKQESLINTITSEVTSDAGKRKEAVMKIYDTLAEATGAPESVREGFKQELNKEFETVGMVDTKKLDETISRMMASPEQLAVKFQKEFEKNGAVGEPSFDELLAFVNTENVAEVIQAYDELNTGESLINAITSEITSDNQARKDAVMHIFNALTEQKGNTDTKDEFVAELDKQFNKAIGMVNTKKLDEIIKNILQLESKVDPNLKRVSVPNDPTKITRTKDNKTFTISELHRGAIASAKNEVIESYKVFCKENGLKFKASDLDLSPLDRIPAPHAKNGKITTAESEILKPTGKPNGRVVILNAGHGGYSSRSGYFDPGAYSFIKKGNGKYAPLIEYEKMKQYANSTAEKLQKEGYTVVIMSGHAETMADEKAVTNLVSRLNAGTKGDQKFELQNMAFISLHADSETTKTGSGVCYDSTFPQDTTFAKHLQNNLNEDEWISAGLSERVWGKNGIGVLHQTENIASSLIEVEYVNGSKSKNLDSSAFKDRFENQLINGLNEYFGLK